MTKTKAQLRAEAVERLTKLNEHGYWEFPVHVALCGRDVPDVDEERAIIADLLTDDCGPCYSCAKLAELVAENSQLRVKVDELAEVLDLQQELLDECDVEATTKSSEKDGNDGETSDVDSRDNGWYLRYDGYMTSKSNYLRISGFKAARALDNRQNLVFVKFMGGTEADCRVYAPKLDVCENLHDSSMETQKPRSREADSGNVSDSDGENLHVEQDTREKLEADVRKYLDLPANCRGWGDYKAVCAWLDRQAAITERHILTHPDERDEQIVELREDVAERDDVIAVLKAENAELQSRHCEWSDPDSLGDGCMLRKDKRVDELTDQLEAAYAKNRSLRQHIAKMQEGRHGWHVKYHELEKNNAELQARVDELEGGGND